MHRIVVATAAILSSFATHAETRLGVAFDGFEVKYSEASQGLSGMTNEEAIEAMRGAFEAHGRRADVYFVLLARLDPSCVLDVRCDDEGLAADRARLILRRLGSSVSGKVRDLRFDFDVRAEGDDLDVVELIVEPTLPTVTPECASGIMVSDSGLPPRRDGTVSRPISPEATSTGYLLRISEKSRLSVPSLPDDWRYVLIHDRRGFVIAAIEISPDSGYSNRSIPHMATAIRIVRTKLPIPEVTMLAGANNTDPNSPTAKSTSPDMLSPSVETGQLPNPSDWELTDVFSSPDIDVCNVLLWRQTP